MYLHLGKDTIIPQADIIGLFDLDNCSWSYKTREFLEQAEQAGQIEEIADDIPKSMIITAEDNGTTVYFSQLSTATLKNRSESGGFDF